MSATAPQNPPHQTDGSFEISGDDESQESLLLGLQLCRANTMSLTRLQLALRNGDRRCALEAIDRLHALDARIENLVERLPHPANEDTDWMAITRHLEDQKIAIAFEKLALASEISGPDMVSTVADEYDYDVRDRSASWPLAATAGAIFPRPVNTRLIMGALFALLLVVVSSSVAIMASTL